MTSSTERQPAPSVTEEIADAVLSWMVKYDLLDAGNEYQAADVLAVLDDFKPSYHSALSAQVQDVAGTVEAFDRDHPELYWHIAKGKITAGEPLYGAIIVDSRGTELGHGESDVSAIDAFNIAMLAAAPAKHEGE